MTRLLSQMPLTGSHSVEVQQPIQRNNSNVHNNDNLQSDERCNLCSSPGHIDYPDVDASKIWGVGSRDLQAVAEQAGPIPLVKNSQHYNADPNAPKQ
jgi:hypothetical protein